MSDKPEKTDEENTDKKKEEKLNEASENINDISKNNDEVWKVKKSENVESQSVLILPENTENLKYIKPLRTKSTKKSDDDTKTKLDTVIVEVVTIFDSAKNITK